MPQPTNDGGNSSASNGSTNWADRIRTAVQNSGDSGAADAAGDDVVDDTNPTDANDASLEAGNDDQGADGADTNDGNDDSGDDSSSAGGNDDAGDQGGQGSDFQPRFSQFSGDGTTETYLKNLENGYKESSQEAIRLKEDRDGLERQVNAIKAAAAQDTEFGEKLLSYLNGNGSNPNNSANSSSTSGDQVTQTSDNPFIINAETEWNRKSEQSAKEFADANPEVMDDPKINAEVKRYIKLFSNDIYEREKRLITAGEAMAMAYKTMGLTDKREQTQNLVDGLKKNAAPTRPQAAKKKPSGNAGKTKQFSDLTLTLADKMGISKERLAKRK